MRRTLVLAIAFGIALATAVWSGQAAAGSLDDLERARAVLIASWLQGDGIHARRAPAIATLALLERRVLNDEGLLGRATPGIRRAFAEPDLTFLASTARWRGMPVIEIWFDAVGLGAEALMTAPVTSLGNPSS